MNNLKKKLKLNKDLYEDMTCEEAMERYEPYLRKKAIDFSRYAEQRYFKHCYAFTIEDFKQVASLGFAKAFEKYDLDKDINFYTYMPWIVKGDILRYIRDTVKARLLSAGKAEYGFRDIPLDSDMDSNRYGGGDSKVHLQETIPDEHDYIEEFIDNDLLKDLMSLLTPKERMLIELQFVHGKTQVQIADTLGITQVQVSRLSKKGLLKMREHIKIHKEKEEGNIMIKLKPSINDIVVYFETHATKEVAFSTTTNKLARDKDLSVSTILKIIKASDKEDYLKYLCKPSQSLIKKHVNIAEIEAKGIEESTADNAVCIDELRTENVKRILEDTPGAVVETTTPESVLDGVKIEYLTVRFNNDNIATYSDKEIKVDNFAQWNTKEQLVECKNNMEKALEIYDFLFSK